VITSAPGARRSQNLVRQLQQARPWPLRRMRTVRTGAPVALTWTRMVSMLPGWEMQCRRLRAPPIPSAPLDSSLAHRSTEGANIQPIRRRRCWTVLRKADLVRWIASSFPRPSISHIAGASPPHSSLFFIATRSKSRHLDDERERANMDGRLHRLEKTVPRAEPHGASGASPGECDDAKETTPGDATDSLSIALARMGLSENSAENLYATSSVFRRLTDYGWLQWALEPWYYRSLIASHVLTRKTTAPAPSRQETTSRYSLARTGPLFPGCLAPS